LRDSAVADGVSGSNGFEIDNDAASSGNKPYTAPIFSNFTIVGPKETLTNPINSNFKRAAHLRKNCRAKIYNTLFLGFPKGITVDGDSCHVAAAANNLKVKHCIISGMTTNLDSVAGSWAITPWFNANSNSALTNNTSQMLTAPFNYTSPNMTPLTGSPALGTASFADTDLAGFDVVTYKGAVGATNWAASTWTNYDPQNTGYTVGIKEQTLVSATLYPNPTTDNLTINVNYDAPFSVTVTNTLGQNLTTPIANTNQKEVAIPTTNLSPGIYLLKVTNAQGQLLNSFRFVKN
jgi:muconolactone delta-isomerase